MRLEENRLKSLDLGLVLLRTAQLDHFYALCSMTTTIAKGPIVEAKQKT